MITGFFNGVYSLLLALTLAGLGSVLLPGPLRRLNEGLAPGAGPGGAIVRGVLVSLWVLPLLWVFEVVALALVAGLETKPGLLPPSAFLAALSVVPWLLLREVRADPPRRGRESLVAWLRSAPSRLLTPMVLAGSIHGVVVVMLWGEVAGLTAWDSRVLVRAGIVVSLATVLVSALSPWSLRRAARRAEAEGRIDPEVVESASRADGGSHA